MLYLLQLLQRFQLGQSVRGFLWVLLGRGLLWVLLRRGFL